MSDIQKKKKKIRTKRIYNHANPLFEQWLLEWKDEADKRGSNMKYNFQRAVASLRKYPLPLYTGKECMMLQNFGVKTCEMIDRRLKKYQDENGPVDWDSVMQVKNQTPKKRAPRKKKIPLTSPKLSNSGTSSTSRTSELFRGDSGYSSSQTSIQRGHPYIPVVQSGGYALLVTLYKESFAQHFAGVVKGFMKKADLIKAAQPLCGTSFLLPPDGSHYTAWSSMSTLLKKGLVQKEGSPARFSLTIEGQDLAGKLANVNGNCESCVPISDPLQVTVGSSKLSHQKIVKKTVQKNSNKKIATSSVQEKWDIQELSLGTIGKRFSREEDDSASAKRIRESPEIFVLSDDDEDEKVASNKITVGKTNFAAPQVTNVDTFVFSYVDSQDMETPLKSRAMVTLEDDGFFGFLIKCRRDALQMSKLEFRWDYSRSAAIGHAYAFLSDASAPEISPGIRSPVKNSCLLVQPLNLVSEVAVPSAMKIIPALKILGSPLKFHENKPANVASNGTQFTLYPGQFEIVLCVDNAETLGGVRNNNKCSTKDIIINELQKHGVMFDVRKLNVGDFLWICREVNSVGEPREVVLPLVIERKRMDDLGSSIRDGRFKEQKFRLRQCGLTRPIYLVEEYGNSYLGLPLSTCEQASVNTQVIDRFTVKVTKDQRETAAYLTILTRYLQSHYKNRSIQAMSRTEVLLLQEQQVETNCSPTGGLDNKLMTFAEFNAGSIKARKFTVREMFVKHLLQLNGISVEKAKAIVDQYPTPAALLSAWAEDAANCDMKLTNLKCEKTGRKIGPVISAHIIGLYTKQHIK